MATPVASQDPDQLPRLIRLQIHSGDLGTLAPFNFDGLPFLPRHAFAVTGVPTPTTRGKHAHRRSSQLMICLNGRVEVEWKRGQAAATISLDRPGLALLVPPGTWSSQTYAAPASVLLVLASEPYSPDDYLPGPSAL